MPQADKLRNGADSENPIFILSGISSVQMIKKVISHSISQWEFLLWRISHGVATIIRLWLIYPTSTGIILCMRPANERRRYSVTSSLIGWVLTQNDPCIKSRKK